MFILMTPLLDSGHIHINDSITGIGPVHIKGFITESGCPNCVHDYI